MTVNHGLSAYHNDGCRCRTCRDAHNTYMRAYQANRRRTGNGGITAHIRDWARANGHRVSDRGTVPRAIADAYTAAHR